MTIQTEVGVMQWWLDTLQNLAGVLKDGLILSLEERLPEARAALKEMLEADGGDKRIQQADECTLQILAIIKDDSFDPREPPVEFVEQKRVLLALLNGGLIPKVLLGIHALARQSW